MFIYQRTRRLRAWLNYGAPTALRECLGECPAFSNPVLLRPTHFSAACLAAEASGVKNPFGSYAHTARLNTFGKNAESGRMQVHRTFLGVAAAAFSRGAALKAAALQ